MKRLVLPVRAAPEWRTPCVDRIVAVCAAHGYTVAREAAEWAWSEYSECEYCTSWMPGAESVDDAALVEIMREYLRETDK